MSSCERPHSIDAGQDAVADAHVDAGSQDGGAADAGGDAAVPDPHVCDFSVGTDAATYCISVRSLDSDLGVAFAEAKVFLSNRHGDWSVLAEAHTDEADGGQLILNASGAMGRTGQVRWYRKDVPSALDSDEFGDLCGISRQTAGVSPAYWPGDGGSERSFAFGGRCLAVQSGKLLVGGLGLWLASVDGTAIRVAASGGRPEEARFVGFLDRGQSLVASSELVGSDLFNFADVVSADGGTLFRLFNPGFQAGVIPTTTSVSGSAAGVGSDNVFSSAPILWPQIGARAVVRLEDPGKRPLEITNLSITGDVCALSAGNPVFWIPPTYEALSFDSGPAADGACVGALPGGRFLISRVGPQATHSNFLLRITRERR